MVYGCDLDSDLKRIAMEIFDAIIIGSGLAGNPLAKKLSKEANLLSLPVNFLKSMVYTSLPVQPARDLSGSDVSR
jgi:hypothetical protein